MLTAPCESELNARVVKNSVIAVCRSKGQQNERNDSAKSFLSKSDLMFLYLSLSIKDEVK